MQDVNPIKNPSIQDNKTRYCKFFNIMSYIYAINVFVLNIYIGYEIVCCFMDDGFSFLGGLFIGASYILTIPLNIFVVIQAKRRRNQKRGARIFFLIVGIITILIGLILYNATPIWTYILLLGLLLVISIIICNYQKKKSQQLPHSASS